MVQKLYLIVIISLLSTAVFSQSATLKGRITDKATGQTLPGAEIHFDDYKNTVLTNENGEYVLANIAAGEYKVKVKFIGYAKFEQKIKIAAGEVMVLDVQISEETENLQIVNIKGRLPTENEAAAIANERNSDNLKNVVSAKAIEKSPDINAANVLQRVSGVTIQRNGGGDDAYAIIRGLEPRYNNTLINGVSIASPSSKTRLVSLSIVPSDLLARIEVDKTLLPDMEGSAIGGTVNLVFKDAPEERQFSATGSLGYSQLFFDRKFQKFSTSDIHKYSPSETNGPAYVAQPNDFTRSNLDFKPVNPPPSGTFSLSYGQRFFNNKMGFIIADSYQNLYFGSNNEGNDGDANPNDPDKRPRINDILNRFISSHQTLNNLIAHFDYKIDDHNKIMLDNVLLYSRIAETLMAADTSITGGNGGRTVTGTGPVSINSQSTLTNQIIENLKLSGEHVINKHFQFDWYGAFSDAFVRTPDQANISTNILISYNPSTGQFLKTPQYFDNIDRVWAHNQGKDFDGSGKLTYTTKLGDDIQLQLIGGGLYRHKTRYNYEDEYILRPAANPDGSKPAFDINTSQWVVYNPSGAGAFNVNNYNGFEDVTAYYGEFKLTFSKLDVLGGVRSESTSQGFYVRQDITKASGVTKDYTDLLPSITFKYKLTDKTNLRLAYFASIARPAYFELVPTVPPGASDGTATEGNSDLKHTTSNNYDFRYEFYPRPDEQFFVGVYYKDLTNPIEYAYIGTNSGTTVLKPINTPYAKVAGVELAFTRYIGDFGLSGNYAYNHSDDYDNLKINRLVPSLNGQPNYAPEHRMLTGAAVHDLNLSFLYRNKKAKINAQLAYQYLGKTLVIRYPDNGDDYIQQPLSNLAFSADKELFKHFTIFTKLNNLLNTHTTVVLHNFQNGNLVTEASYLVGLRYNY